MRGAESHLNEREIIDVLGELLADNNIRFTERERVAFAEIRRRVEVALWLERVIDEAAEAAGLVDKSHPNRPRLLVCAVRTLRDEKDRLSRER